MADGGIVSAQLERASRLALEFDGVSWALCHGRTPFIEMSLSGISLVNLRNRDQSGAQPYPLHVQNRTSLSLPDMLCSASPDSLECLVNEFADYSRAVRRFAKRRRMLSGRPARDDDMPADQSSEHEHAIFPNWASG